MRQGDLIWLACFAAAGLMLVLPGPGSFLYQLSADHRYLSGFLYFALMGALAEAIGARFSGRDYPGARSLAGLAFMWGLHGLVLALVFWLVNGGVIMTQTVGMLPGGGYGSSSRPIKAILTSFFITGPFFTSFFLNLSFIPVLLAVQRLARAYFLVAGQDGRRPPLARVSEAADWPDFIRSELPCSLLFRTPFLILVFMLPSDLWLLMASLGLVVVAVLSGLSQRRSAGPDEPGPEEAAKPLHRRLPKKSLRQRRRRSRFFFSPSVRNHSVISRPDCRQGRPLMRVRKSQ